MFHLVCPNVRISGRHFLTFPGTYFTNSCTFLAMIGLMFTAFFIALPANICTDLANSFCHFTSQTHKLCRSITDRGTFHIQLNTSCHHLYIFLLRAGTCTMVTGIGTTKTGFNAGFVFGIIIGLFHLTGFMTHSKSQTI